jgi:hypothetical protein
MKLPAPLQTYFTARSPQDAAMLAAAFAPQAVVRDEGQTLQGPEQILHWWQAAKAKYAHRADPVEMSELAGKTVVRARVSGNFPGSPAMLTFTFGLTGDRISELEIGG